MLPMWGTAELTFSQKGDAAPHHRPFLCDGAGEDGEHYEGGSGNAPQKKRDYARHWDSGYRGDGYGDSSVQKGDIVLLCTDGLSGMLKDEEMAKILSKRIALDKKAAILVEEANRQGGHDNISLILVEI